MSKLQEYLKSLSVEEMRALKQTALLAAHLASTNGDPERLRECNIILEPFLKALAEDNDLMNFTGNLEQ